MGLFNWSKPDTRARRDAPQPGRRRRSRVVGVGERQRRHRQDARADHARAAPAAGRYAARANPGADLHQGGGRRDVEAGVRSPGRLGDGARCQARRQAQGAARPGADLGRDAARAPAVRHRHRDARRPQGADHPRLLRAAAAALSAGGRRRAGLCHPRRPGAQRPAARGDRRGADRGDLERQVVHRQGAAVGDRLRHRGRLRRPAGRSPARARLADGGRAPRRR